MRDRGEEELSFQSPFLYRIMYFSNTKLLWPDEYGQKICILVKNSTLLIFGPFSSPVLIRYVFQVSGSLNVGYTHPVLTAAKWAVPLNNILTGYQLARREIN